MWLIIIFGAIVGTFFTKNLIHLFNIDVNNSEYDIFDSILKIYGFLIGILFTVIIKFMLFH